jgi:hypothetical protein
MEGPGQVSYGTTSGALAATAETVDDHTATLSSHAASISANSSAIAALAGVPSGAVVAFRTGAEVTAAGAGWARETALDGRILLGAGTAGGQTFTEANNYGTNWTASTTATAAGTGGSVNSGAGATADVQGHQHPVSVTLIPPGRAYVYARKS